MTDHGSLERRLEKTDDRVNGLSRQAERINERQNTTFERMKVNDVEVKGLKEDMDLMKIEAKNRWPHLIASFLGAIIPTLGMMIMFWKFVWPIVAEASLKGAVQ